MLQNKRNEFAISFLALAFLTGNVIVANSQTRVSIGVTETIETAQSLRRQRLASLRNFERNHRPFLHLQLHQRETSKAGSPSDGKPKTPPPGFST